MRWTQRSVRRALLVADGEAVWFWRPEAGVKFARTPTRRADDGVNKAVVPGESAEQTVKPLRGECRMFRCLRCEYLCAYSLPHSAHRAAGALGTRHSPRPLLSRDTTTASTRGKHRLRAQSLVGRPKESNHVAMIVLPREPGQRELMERMGVERGERATGFCIA